MLNRTSFQKTWESKDRDNYIGKAEATVWHHHLMNSGAISVQDRLTGDVWDIETAYRSPCGQFWLASCGHDIRDHLHRLNSEEEMIDWVMDRANNCRGGHHSGERYGLTLEQLERRNNWKPIAAAPKLAGESE